MTTKRIAIILMGKVQGVGFRYSSRTAANRLNLTGFSRNEDDGSVYIEIEGSEENIEEFLKWCRHGPANAVVESINYKESELAGYTEFVIY